MNRRWAALTFATLVGSGSVQSQELNVFSNGESADADGINENFSTLEQRISSQLSNYEVSVSTNAFFLAGTSPDSFFSRDSGVFRGFG